jgi:epoxyqueuosine reductase
VGISAGLDRIGVAPATVLHRALDALHTRRDAGLHDGMQFTYRNPERSTDPGAAVAGARSVIVGARSYAMATGDAAEPTDPGETPERPGPAARVARYAWTDHYAPLREALRTVARQLRADGHRAVAFADDNSIVDREVAWAAGLGWFGKNANLLLPGGGSYFVLGCVITTAELPPSAAPAPDGCGSCTACIGACPTGAIVAPGTIDARRCLAWVLQKPGIIPPELRIAIGDRLYGCDDCQEACPPTVRLEVRHRRAGPAEPLVPVLGLLRADDETLLAAHGRWYLADRDPRWWRRNALVVLGNVGDPDDPDVVAELRRHLCHQDPMLRAHAVWAAARLGVFDLLPATDGDPDVQAEIDAACRVRRSATPYASRQR